jgi:hypothetical protein
MINKTFGELTFNTGWKTKIELVLFGVVHSVVINIFAYFEKDGVTPEQESASATFIERKEADLKTVERLLDQFADGNASERFTPRTLLFQRDGSYALLLDDEVEPDGGVAVILAPEAKVLYQDDYL